MHSSKRSQKPGPPLRYDYRRHLHAAWRTTHASCFGAVYHAWPCLLQHITTDSVTACSCFSNTSHTSSKLQAFRLQDGHHLLVRLTMMLPECVSDQAAELCLLPLQELLQLQYVRDGLKAYAKHVARKVAKRQSSFEEVLLQYHLTDDEEVSTLCVSINCVLTACKAAERLSCKTNDWNHRLRNLIHLLHGPATLVREQR